MSDYAYAVKFLNEHGIEIERSISKSGYNQAVPKQVQKLLENHTDLIGIGKSFNVKDNLPVNVDNIGSKLSDPTQVKDLLKNQANPLGIGKSFNVKDNLPVNVDNIGSKLPDPTQVKDLLKNQANPLGIVKSFNAEDSLPVNVDKGGYKQPDPQQIEELLKNQTKLLGAGRGFAADNVLPASVDNSKNFKIVDQGQEGSCTANAGCGAMFMRDVIEYLAQNPDINLDTALSTVPYLSRNYVYYYERDLEGTTASDSGATIADLINVLMKRGAPKETSYPYDDSKFAQQPPSSLDAEAAENKDVDGDIAYQVIDTKASDLIQQLKTAVYKGYGVVFGTKIFQSFESDDVGKTGDVPMPTIYDSYLGGHALTIVGFDDVTQRFLIANSWGTGWGKQGFITMPYDYFTYGQKSVVPNLPSPAVPGLGLPSAPGALSQVLKAPDTPLAQPYLLEAYVIGRTTSSVLK